jgi:rhomboid protease GluP
MDNENTTEEIQSSEAEQQARIKKNSFSAFIPKGDYFFTPILIDINFLIFILMCLSGVSFTFPDGESLLKWGANFRPLVMNGEPWRMFTSMFLHFGILHIASNMYALYSIGRILEPFIGKWRFLALYLMAGLGGSAVSLWWRDGGVGAGASGAIFGTFGIFAALLTTDLIDKSIRGRLLRSIGGAIGLNLVIGMSPGIDNSAHIGGLITGAIGGYLCYFDLKAWYYNHIKKYTGLIITGIITVIIIVFFWMIIPPTPYASPAETTVKWEKWTKEFTAEEKDANDFYNSITPTTPAHLIQEKVVMPWKHCLALTDSLLQLSLNEREQHVAEELQTYSQIRMEAGQALFRAAIDHRTDLKDSASVLNHQADSIVNALNGYATESDKK